METANDELMAPPTPPRLRVAMALYSSLDHDSRVLREAGSLSSAGFDVTVYCLDWAGGSDVPFRVVTHRPDRSGVLPDGSSTFHRAGPSNIATRLVRLVRWMVGYVRNIRAWGRWIVQDAGAVDVWHAHDLPGLMAVGPHLHHDARLVYDSHEIFLEAGTATRLPSVVRRLLSRYERRLVRRATALVTVNEAYAGVLEKRLSPRRVVIVRNCPPRWEPAGPPPGLRAGSGVAADHRLVLYHGALAAHRGIEQSVDALAKPGMETTDLVLLGFGDTRLLGLVPNEPERTRVHHLDAVAPAVLLDWVAEADIDVMPLQRSSLNHWLCTPNKLWESLAAGVPVVVSDFPVMRHIVLDDPAGPLGAVCDPADPASIAASIRSVLDMPAKDREAMRTRCRTAAHERWNWEAESSRLVALYDEFRTPV